MTALEAGHPLDQSCVHQLLIRARHIGVARGQVAQRDQQAAQRNCACVSITRLQRALWERWQLRQGRLSGEFLIAVQSRLEQTIVPKGRLKRRKFSSEVMAAGKPLQQGWRV